MVNIPQNIDAYLIKNLSGEKLYEYLLLKDMTPDSSLDSLALAWVYRADMANQTTLTVVFGISLVITVIIAAWIAENS